MSEMDPNGGAPSDPADEPQRTSTEGASGVAEMQRRLRGALDAGGFSGGDNAGRGALMNVPITLRAVLGEARLPMARFLALGPGDLVTLERLVGEPIELTVNDSPIARGEIVMLDEESGQLGVRVLALLDAAA